MGAFGRSVALFTGLVGGGMLGFYAIDVYKRRVLGISRERELQLRVDKALRELQASNEREAAVHEQRMREAEARRREKQNQ